MKVIQTLNDLEWLKARLTVKDNHESVRRIDKVGISSLRAYVYFFA